MVTILTETGLIVFAVYYIITTDYKFTTLTRTSNNKRKLKFE